MPTLTPAQVTVDCLLHAGIRQVFALPGYHNDPLFDAFYAAKDRLRVIHPRHEQAAGYMALGAALATGKPQALCVVPGPGLLNAGAALLTAYGMNAPVLALVGQIPQADIDRAYGHLHEIPDQVGLARHFTKHAARVSSAQEAAERVPEAIRIATSGRPRPVMIECALDAWGRPGAVTLPAPLPPPPAAAVDEDAVEAAAKLLGAARRPLIVAGGGALDAAPQVRAIAEALEAPVITYRRGRGAIPSTHPLGGNLPLGHRLWKDADAVLGIGTRMLFHQADWGLDANLKVVRIDIDPEEHDRVRKPAVALVGDAAATLSVLLERLPRHNSPRPGRAQEVAAAKAAMQADVNKLEPQRGYLKAIRAALPPEGIFVDEVTQIGFVSRLDYDVPAPRTYLSPGYQDNLGWGLGTALGAKAARPDVPVVAITGDGGLMYQIGELATAVHHKLAVVVVLFDNSSFGNVKRIQQERFGGRLIASDLTNPDFMALARSFGVAAFQAKSPPELEPVLRKAIALDAPALVHVPCGDMPSPWPLIHMPRVRG